MNVLAPHCRLTNVLGCPWSRVLLIAQQYKEQKVIVSVCFLCVRLKNFSYRPTFSKASKQPAFAYLAVNRSRSVRIKRRG